MPKYTIFSEEQAALIIEYYLAPHSVRNTAEHFSTASSVITKVLAAHNIKLRGKAEIAKAKSLAMKQS